MKVTTKLFGEIDIEDEKIITFADGIIGFSNLKEFTIIAEETEEKKSSILWLQSMTDGEFSIPVINPLFVKPDYNPSVEDELLKAIGGFDEDNITVLVTITVPEEIEKMSVNLRAPLVINSNTTKGCQIILDGDDTDIRFPIYDILKAAKEGA